MSCVESESSVAPSRREAEYQGKVFVFTVNNPTGACLPLPDFGPKLASALLRGKTRYEMAYAVWSHETASSGTPHLQGYLQLKKKVKHQALKNKMAPFGAWLQRANGTAQENIDYIGHTGKHGDKPGLIAGPWEYGTVDHTTSGQRTDLDAMVNAIKAGSSLKDLCKDHTQGMLKYFGNASKISQLLSEKVRAWRTELYIYTGRAGSGKSYSAHEEAREFLQQLGMDEEPYDLMVPSKGQPLWFQDYTGQAVVIIDDFYGSIDIDFIKRLIDEYPVKVNVKNGNAQFLARRVYITSNVGWKNWWAAELLANANNIEAIQRRITVEKTFTETYEERVQEASLVTMLNDQPLNDEVLNIGEVGELACDEDFDEIVRGNRNAPLSPEVYHNQEADPDMKAWADNAMKNWSDFI